MGTCRPPVDASPANRIDVFQKAIARFYCFGRKIWES
jgi:hypothetical protein